MSKIKNEKYESHIKDTIQAAIKVLEPSEKELVSIRWIDGSMENVRMFQVIVWDDQSHLASTVAGMVHFLVRNYKGFTPIHQLCYEDDRVLFRYGDNAEKGKLC